MATLREIKRRIVGVKSTAKITQAMKMVAAAKLRRAQDGINAARPYSRALEMLLKDVLRSVTEETGKSPLLYGRKHEEPNMDRVLLIVITSDRGLAGAFNSGLIRFAENRIHDEYSEHQKSGRLNLITVGRRGTDHFTKRGYPILDRYVGIFTKLEFATARAIKNQAVDLFNRGECDRVEIIYNMFKSVVAQKPSAERLLPVLDESVTSGGTDTEENLEYIFEPEPDSILNVLVPSHLETMIWKALLESNAAEQGARMTAMDSATRNARDLVNALQLSFNKARQAAITKEILEIVGGAEALSQA
ncbi:MAG: ATP synthase F1 subunit gamma [Candidatus Kapaibacterium sp.]|jgi:F-type H+-transporting ATPase subunit gamma